MVDTMEDTEERLLGYRKVEYRDGSLKRNSIVTLLPLYNYTQTCLNLKV